MIDSSLDFRIYELCMDHIMSNLYNSLVIILFLHKRYACLSVELNNKNHFRLAFGKHDNEQAVKNLD